MQINKIFHATLLASGKAEGAKVPDPSAPFNIIPFIITDELKMFYYRGLKEWGHIDGYLTDTCLTAQDQYKNLLRYFKLKA